MLHKNPSKLPDSIRKNYKSFLKKSGNNIDELLFSYPGREIWEWEGGWLDYYIMGKTFMVSTIMVKDRTLDRFYRLYKYAQSKGCNKICFFTFRNPEAFVKIIQKAIDKYSEEGRESVMKVRTVHQIDVNI